MSLMPSVQPSDSPSSVPTGSPTRPQTGGQPTNSSLPAENQQQASCTEDEVLFRIDLGIDAYGNETTYEIWDKDTLVLIASGGDFEADTVYSRTGCLAKSADYIFKLLDGWGDGLCCNYGAGFYFLYVDGDLVTKGGVFGHETATQFSVPSS